MNPFALPKQLLWKDYRQMRPAVVGCWLIMGVILLLCCVRQLMDLRDEFMPDAILLVLSAPTLVAMAASGVLIGHERQTRTWNWSSSLPVSWSSTMLSKVCIWLLSSLLTVATLYLLFLALVQVCRQFGYTGGTLPQWLTVHMALAAVLTVPLIVIMWFSLAALLWDDTLTAFTVAAAWVMLAYMLVSDLLPRYLLNNPYGSFDRAATTLSTQLTVFLLVLLPAAVVAWSYRWRWTSGQHKSMRWTQRLPLPMSTYQRRLSWQSFSWSAGPRSEFKMLLSHGMLASTFTRLLVFSLTLGTILMSLVYRTNLALQEFAAIGTTILGVTVFASDQTGAAYKFFADRGVTWHKFLWAHALPPLALAMVPALVAAFSLLPNVRVEESVTWIAFNVILTVAFFLVGIFCGLCSRIPLVCLVMAFGAAGAATLAMVSLNEFYTILQSFTPFYVIASVFLVEVAVLCFATVKLLKHWLVRDRVWGLAYYVTTLLLAVVPAHLVAAGLCFLTVPNVPWQGLDPAEVQVTSSLPRVELATFPIEVYHRHFIPSLDDLEVLVKDTYMGGIGFVREVEPKEKEEYGLGTSRATETVFDKESLGKGLEALEKQLTELQDAPQVTATNYITLSNNIEKSAWLASYATQKLKDVELARRAWKVNRQLLTLVDYRCLEAERTIESRLLSAMLRNRLSEEDWSLLRTGGELEDIQPEPVSVETWIHLVKMIHTHFRARVEYGSPWFATLVAPARWNIERWRALHLQQQIQALKGQSVAALAMPMPLHILQDQTRLSLLVDTEDRLPKR